MPVTGRRELDEGYRPLSIEELAAVYRVLRALEVPVMTGGQVAFTTALLEDLDRVRYALTRIKFLTTEDKA